MSVCLSVCLLDWGHFLLYTLKSLLLSVQRCAYWENVFFFLCFMSLGE